MNLFRFINRLRFLPEHKRIEYYPYFWLMRVRVLEISNNWQLVRIRLPLTAFSRNMGGNMFGGFQASLADPIAALVCVRRFPGYSVWTRRLVLDFQREGSTDLELRFEFDPGIDRQISQDLATKGRSTPTFTFGYYLTDGTLCTKVHNTVAIRPKGYKST